MKVYNEEKTEVLETCDLTKGFLKTDKILKVHHEAVPAIPAVTVASKIEVILKNGGKIIEVDGVYYEVVTIRNDYEIEPLVVVETDGEYYATGAVQALEKRVAALEQALQKEIAVKEEILAKFEDFADNGVNVQFTDEENNSN